MRTAVMVFLLLDDGISLPQGKQAASQEGRQAIPSVVPGWLA